MMFGGSQTPTCHPWCFSCAAGGMPFGGCEQAHTPSSFLNGRPPAALYATNCTCSNNHCAFRATLLTSIIIMLVPYALRPRRSCAPILWQASSRDIAAIVLLSHRHCDPAPQHACSWRQTLMTFRVSALRTHLLRNTSASRPEVRSLCYCCLLGAPAALITTTGVCKAPAPQGSGSPTCADG